MSGKYDTALNDPATASSFSNVEEPNGYLYVPKDPMAGIGQIKPGAIVGGMGGGMGLLQPGLQGGIPAMPGPDYLQYDLKGRGWSEKTFFNVGTTYLAGIAFGGSYGFFDGLRTSPSTKFNIRLNTVLNKMGKHGSGVGNALGSVVLIYSLTDSLLERGFETDRFFDRYIESRSISELATPTLAGLCTGLVYKSTMGPKTMALAGVLGAATALGIEAARKAYGIH